MKKIVLLLLSVSVLFLIGGCGRGGNEVTASNPSPGEPIAAGMGRIVVSFVTEAAKQSQALSANHGRVVVRKFDTVHFEGIDPDTDEPYSYDIFTLAFQGISDGSIPGDVAVQVPAGNGYIVDILTYAANVDGNGLNAVLQYSTKSDVSVTQGINNAITMPSLADCLPPDSLNVPNLVESGITYDLSKVYAPPIRNDMIGFVKASTTPFANDWFAFNAANSRINNFLAPASSVTPWPTLYLQGQFFIDTGLLKPAEPWYSWACYQTTQTEISPPTNVKITFP